MFQKYCVYLNISDNFIRMLLQNINWNKKTILYVFAINSFVKFGITNNWKKREKIYYKDFENQPPIFIKSFDFPNRWQAELIEQVVKWRLKKWIVYGRHEYTELPVNIVLKCIYETIKELEIEFDRHKYIHRRGNERWDFYRQIAQIFFKEIKFDEKKEIMHNTNDENIELPNVELIINSYSENLLGKSAYAVILTYKEYEKKLLKAYKFTTANRIELLGIIHGINSLKKKSKVTIYTKMKYIINPFENKWINNWVENNWHSGNRPIANADLWKEFLKLFNFHEVEFVHADKNTLTKYKNLVKDVLQNEELNIDENFEKKYDKNDNGEHLTVYSTKKIKNEGDLCRKCQTPVVKKIPKHKKMKNNQSYYYEYYLVCPNCKKRHMVNDAKIML